MLNRFLKPTIVLLCFGIFGPATSRAVAQLPTAEDLTAPQINQEELQRLREAAEQGDPLSQYELGSYYHTGEGVVQNDEAAAEWYEKSAQQGLAEAQYMFGVVVHEGLGTPSDSVKGAEWLTKAAEQGLVDAQRVLISILIDKNSPTYAPDEAVKWTKKLAEDGDVDVQYLLGVLYVEGELIEKDLDAAATWFRRAADQSHVGAAIALLKLQQQKQPIQEQEAQARKVDWSTRSQLPAAVLGLCFAFLITGKVLSKKLGRKVSGARAFLYASLIYFVVGIIYFSYSGFSAISQNPNISADAIAANVSRPIGYLMGQLLIPTVIAYTVLRCSGERLRKQKSPVAPDSQEDTSTAAEIA